MELAISFETAVLKNDEDRGPNEVEIVILVRIINIFTSFQFSKGIATSC